MKKQGTVFPWVAGVKSETIAKGFLILITAIASLTAGYIVLYGDDRWFAKTRGESVEKKQVVLELELDHRHEMHMAEQKHIYDKLDELKIILEKEDR